MMDGPVTFLPLANQLAVTGASGIDIINFAQSKKIRALIPAVNARSVELPVAVSLDGKWLFSADNDTSLGAVPRLHIWDVISGEETFPEQPILDLPPMPPPYRKRLTGGGSAAMTISPDGKVIAIGNTLWDTASLSKIGQIDDKSFASLVFSANSRMLATGGNESITLWDVATRKIIRRIGAQEQTVSSGNSYSAMTFSPDGGFLAVLRADNNLMLFDVETATLKWKVKDYRASALGGAGALNVLGKIAFTPDGNHLLIFAHQKPNAYFSFRRVDNGKESKRIFLGDLGELFNDPESALTDISFYSDFDLIEGADKVAISYIRRFSPQARQTLTWTHKQDLSSQDALSWRGQAHVSILDLRGKKILYTFKEPKFRNMDGGLIKISTSPDHKLLAIGGEQGEIRIWDVQTGAEKFEIKHDAPQEAQSIQQLLFSADGRRLYSQGTRYRVWDIASGREIFVRD